jgi:hypothetical protein
MAKTTTVVVWARFGCDPAHQWSYGMMVGAVVEVATVDVLTNNHDGGRMGRRAERETFSINEQFFPSHVKPARVASQPAGWIAFTMMQLMTCTGGCMMNMYFPFRETPRRDLEEFPKKKSSIP